MKITFDHQTLIFFCMKKHKGKKSKYNHSLVSFFFKYHVCAGLNINQGEHNLREAKTSFLPVLPVEQAACLVQLMVPFYNDISMTL